MSVTRRRCCRAPWVPLALAAAPGTAHAAASRPSPPSTSRATPPPRPSNPPPRPRPAGGWPCRSSWRTRFAVSNHAVNGRSSKSFYDEGRLDPDSVRRPPRRPPPRPVRPQRREDRGPARGTPTHGPTYPQYLRHVPRRRARARRAPVLADLRGAPPVRRGGRGPADARRVPRRRSGASPSWRASRCSTSRRFSIALWQRLGLEATQGYFNWRSRELPNYPPVQDNTHFQSARARSRWPGSSRGSCCGPRVLRRAMSAAGRRDPGAWITWP